MREAAYVGFRWRSPCWPARLTRAPGPDLACDNAARLGIAWGVGALLVLSVNVYKLARIGALFAQQRPILQAPQEAGLRV